MLKAVHQVPEDSVDKKFMTREAITLLVSESSCCDFFDRRLNIIRKHNVTEVITTVKCLLCSEELKVKNITFMYLHLYQYHIHSFVQAMFILSKDVNLPMCTLGYTPHVCYYNSVPCDLNEVFRITVISHCIATARVPKELKTLANEFLRERSQLFSSNTDVRPILNKIKELIPDFSFSLQ